MMASTSICTCSRLGGLGFGAALAGGPFGMGFADTVDGSTSGVSGAKVVAGEGGAMTPILAVSLGSPRC